jgi:hypothetical protein
MTKIRIIAGCVLVCATSMSPAVRALDLAGFELGSELTMTNRADMTRVEGGFCTERACSGQRMLGDYPARVVIEANNDGRLHYISVALPVEKAGLLLQSATAKFGKPRKTTASEVQNLFGAKFSQAAVMWKTSEGSVHFFERCGKITESCLVAIAAGWTPPDAGARLKL